MNSQNLGNLASDHKIKKVFHAFGYSIPAGKDGRRMWPTKFKREMAHQMNTGKLTVAEVQKVCRVPDKTAYSWRNHYSNAPKNNPSPEPVADATFVEVQLADGEQKSTASKQPIIFRRG